MCVTEIWICSKSLAGALDARRFGVIRKGS
jgi:hypothetical protein